MSFLQTLIDRVNQPAIETVNTMKQYIKQNKPHKFDPVTVSMCYYTKHPFQRGTHIELFDASYAANFATVKSSLDQCTEHERMAAIFRVAVWASEHEIHLQPSSIVAHQPSGFIRRDGSSRSSRARTPAAEQHHHHATGQRRLATRSTPSGKH